MTYKLVVLGFLFFLLGVNPIFSQRNIDNEIIVTLHDSYDFHDLTLFLSTSRSGELSFVRKIAQDEEWYLLETTAERETIIRSLSSYKLFDEVFPNTTIQPRFTPNDPNYSSQWNLGKLDIEKVWDITMGDTTILGDQIVIAILDDGFDLDHEDLQGNIYSNPFDQTGDMNDDGCPGNCGVDDDGDGLIDEDNLGREPGDPGYDISYRVDDDENGYKDDTNGLYATLGNDSHPVRGHGTSVAGIIGAQTNNNIGISGIAYNTKILPLSSGLSPADVIETYNYIAAMRKLYNDTNGEKGAFIVACNYSLGIDGVQPEDYPVWCSMYDKMGEQGIISPVAVTNDNVNIDVVGDVPGNCVSDYKISVTSTDIEDNFAEAGFGKENVNIAAPGSAIYTIRSGTTSGYGSFPGTSAATPHVTGVVGLLYSIPCESFIRYFKNNPSKVDSLAKIIIDAGDELSSLKGLVKSEKRLNANNAMNALGAFCGSTIDGLKITKIYPNPTGDELFFEFNSEPAEKIYVKIYNILGQEIYSDNIETMLFQNTKWSIFTGNLITGMYFINLQQGKNNSTKRFYKM